MRRHSRFTAYNPKTIAAVKGIFESWQIPSRDAREGMHSLVNGVANTADLLADEFRYMARRFLPLTADLSEAWILYRADLACSSLYRNGEPLEESVTQVSTIDDLVDGYPTSFSAAETTTLDGRVRACAALGSDSIRFIMENGSVVEYDLVNDTTSTIKEHVPTTSTLSSTIDQNCRIVPIYSEFDDGTVVASDSKTGRAIAVKVISKKQTTGEYDSEIDFDKDGIISWSDIEFLKKYLNIDQGEMTPDEWAVIDGADLDRDGMIGSKDLSIAMTRYPSFGLGVYGAVIFPATYFGKADITFTVSEETPAALVRTGDSLSIVYTNAPIVSVMKRVTYDSVTGIWYGITNDGLSLRAFRVSQTGHVVSDVLLRTSRWGTAVRLIDVTVCSGYLFLLMGDGLTSRVEVFDIHKEFVVESECVIPVTGVVAPSAIAITDSWTVFLVSGKSVTRCTPLRDLFYDDADATFITRPYSLTTNDGTSVDVTPVYIFNSFDSFFYNLGLTRAPGLSNEEFLLVGLDVFVHPRNNTRVGMSHGMTRDMGFVSEDVWASRFLFLPNEWVPGPTYLGPYEMEMTGTGDTRTLEYGGYGFRIHYGHILEVLYIPDDRPTSVNMRGTFLDADGIEWTLDHPVVLPVGAREPRISVHTLGETDYLERIGLYSGGFPTAAFKTAVRTRDAGHPGTYGGAVVNLSAPDVLRVPYAPVVPTTFDDVPSFTDTEVTL